MEKLGHMGILGMHWGRGGKGSGSKGNTKSRLKKYASGFKKENKGSKMTFNRKKLIKGKSLTRDVLEAIGSHAVINLAISTTAGGPAGPTLLALGVVGHLVTKANLASKIIQRVEHPAKKKK